MLKPGTRLGPHEILSLLGAGGMGEVYKARDTRLNRIVALKVLAPHLANHPEARERFEREAQTIANLKHPNICVLYDIGHDAGTHYLVLEYLEGETLAQRIAKGPLPLDLVLQYAAEIADALDKAHRLGATHRDIKPGNIMIVATSGTASKTGSKLLDFGLAKLKQEVTKATIPASERPTVPGALTQDGTILGTLQYMSPEQLESKEVDGRADIFSFGALVYELVTGKKAFPGETQASVIAKVLDHDPPPMSSLRPMTPPTLDRVVKTCLAKDADERWQTARDLWRELTWIREAGAETAKAPVAEQKPVAKGWRHALRSLGAGGLAVGFLAGAILIGLAVWNLKPSATPIAQATARLTVNLPPGDQLGDLDYPSVALSPDGTRLVYVGSRGGIRQLYVRAIDSLETKPIPATQGAAVPFFSPDGQWIGFFAQRKLKKISITGQSLQTLCDIPGIPRGGSWGADDTIFFVPTSPSGVWKVSASGGAPQEVTRLDRSKRENNHRWPQILPGGKTLLFTIRKGLGSDDSQIVAEVLATGERRVLIEGAHMGRYVPTGHLVYWRNGTLLALSFDPARLEVTGNVPVTIAEGVMAGEANIGPLFEVSSAGPLVYVPASPHQFERRPVWVDRKGQVEIIPAPARPYSDPALSPDGRQVAFEMKDVWILELARGALTRFTSEVGGSANPIWTPDGKRIIYWGYRNGLRNIFGRAADGRGGEERLTTGEEAQFPGSVSSDGKFLAFVRTDLKTDDDIWMLPLEGDRKPQAFLRTSFAEQSPKFSPDGRWVAYKSNESGQDEIYVQQFPGPGGKWQISTEGGSEPHWARNGRELFYLNGDKMLVVEVNATPSGFSASKPRLLFEGHFGGRFREYDVAPDGQRFLMVQSVEPEQPATQINVVLNWAKAVTISK